MVALVMSDDKLKNREVDLSFVRNNSHGGCAESCDSGKIEAKF